MGSVPSQNCESIVVGIACPVAAPDVRQITCMQIWATGDPSTADAIMAEDVRNVDLLFAHETSGRAEFKSMIHSVFKVSINAVFPCILTMVWSQLVCTFFVKKAGLQSLI